ncbi:haloacid dehalogenase [Niveispirillum lacus]|uniref:Haloacid dehalogenase n=1 Tax=Niveispirillum lacus TaxID=1981099 RepID=A0A255YUN3_9PROT|nr:HAD-IB family hydrolase [Niveispirillum lacus]OYQ32365.1 haloacid dehalogenase [Niveispirillum lacus]
MIRRTAIFDFDGTLVGGDSLLPYLGRVAGRMRSGLVFARAIRAGLMSAGTNPDDDLRTRIKAGMLHRALAGVPIAVAQEAAERMRGWPRWYEPTLTALKRHADAGDLVVVATGGLSLYIPTLLEGLPVDRILATDIEEQDGVLTGRMQGGNCVRAEKARRVAALLHELGPFDETHGYGNRPSDLPFLALMSHPRVIPTVPRR